MGFLDKVKNNAAQAAVPKPVTLAAPMAPVTKVTANPLKVNPLGGKLVTPLAAQQKKPAVLPFESIKTELKPVGKEVIGEKVNPFQPKQEPVKEVEVAETKQEEKVETKTETVEEKVEVKTEESASAEEKKTSNKKASSKKSTKEQEKNVETKAAEVCDTITSEQFPTTNTSFEEAIEAIKSPFVNKEWDDFRNEVDTELDSIVIESDMNPAILKGVIEGLSALRQKVWLPYVDTKTLLENLVGDKNSDGLIQIVQKTNLGNATNDKERTRAGYLACMAYVPRNSTEPINLYEVLAETRARYNFLKGAMDSIEYKRSILITMNGALKLEQSLLGGEV
jgi:hypothetical protein